MIRSSESFHFTVIVKFVSDRFAAKAGTFDFLRKVFAERPYNLLLATFPGKHIAPANLSRSNVEMGDLLLNCLKQLRVVFEVNWDKAAATVSADETVIADIRV